ncbi:MAG: hypothetical protein IJM94_06695 [Clostridia bacterium]|nr:hypothetical protein [Clostridia bacterium]
MENKNLPELTDEQIIKALECCSQKNTCHECPYNNAFFAQLCLYLLIRDTFALIKRLLTQNSELHQIILNYNKAVDDLKETYSKTLMRCDELSDLSDGVFKIVKSELIKDLLLRLKECEKVIGEDNELKPYILVEDLNGIAKEMMGDKKRGIE